MGTGTGTSLSFFAAGVAAPTCSLFEPSIDHAVVATWETDLVAGLVNGNVALALFFGLPDDMTEGIPMQRLLAAIHPLDIVRVVGALEASIARRDRFEAVYRVQGRDRQRTLLARSRVVRDAEDRALQHVGAAYELLI